MLHALHLMGKFPAKDTAAEKHHEEAVATAWGLKSFECIKMVYAHVLDIINMQIQHHSN